MPLSRRSDVELIRLTRSDPEAIGELYDRHVDVVLAFVYRQCSDPELSADVTAETFAAVLAGSAKFNRSNPSVRAWLMTVARNKLIDAQRRSGAERRARDILGIRDATQAFDDIEELEARIDAQESKGVLALVDGLPEAERNAVRAVVLQGLTPREAAAASSTSVPTLQKRVSRGLARLARSKYGDLK